MYFFISLYKFFDKDTGFLSGCPTKQASIETFIFVIHTSIHMSKNISIPMGKPEISRHYIQLCCLSGRTLEILNKKENCVRKGNILHLSTYKSVWLFNFKNILYIYSLLNGMTCKLRVEFYSANQNQEMCLYL